MDSIPDRLKTNYPTKINQTWLYAFLQQQEDPGHLAWKYLTLHEKVRSDSFLNRFHFYNDLLVQPVFILFFWVGFLFFPNLLRWIGVLRSEPTRMNLFLWTISTLQILWKCVTLATLVVDYHATVDTIQWWHVITHHNGGPYITTPAKYSVFAYADAVARIKQTLLTELQTSS
jgi:hypothetical protein